MSKNEQIEQWLKCELEKIEGDSLIRGVLTANKYARAGAQYFELGGEGDRYPISSTFNTF